MISRDNVSVKVNAVVYFRVIDPEKAIMQVEDFNDATSQLAQTTLRSVLGHHDLDEMLSERDQLNSDIQQILDEQTDAWGIKVSNVEIKHVDINETMIRAIAKQAEAERDPARQGHRCRGRTCRASKKLLEAAQMLAVKPQAMQSRSPAVHIAGDVEHHRLPGAGRFHGNCSSPREHWRVERGEPAVSCPSVAAQNPAARQGGNLGPSGMLRPRFRRISGPVPAKPFLSVCRFVESREG